MHKKRRKQLNEVKRPAKLTIEQLEKELRCKSCFETRPKMRFEPIRDDSSDEILAYIRRKMETLANEL